MTVKIALAITSFNRADTLRKTIQHTLDNLPETLSLHVLNNGSTDTTADVLNQFDHPRYQKYRQSPKSAGEGLVEILARPPADYVILMSDEDELDWTHYELLVDRLEANHEEITFISTKFRHSDGFVRSNAAGQISPKQSFASAFYMSGLVYNKTALDDALKLFTPVMLQWEFTRLYPQAALALILLKHGKSYWWPIELTKERDNLGPGGRMTDGTPFWERNNRRRLYSDYQSFLDYLITEDVEHKHIWETARHDTVIGSWR